MRITNLNDDGLRVKDYLTESARHATVSSIVIEHQFDATYMMLYYTMHALFFHTHLINVYIGDFGVDSNLALNCCLKIYILFTV